VKIQYAGHNALEAFAITFSDDSVVAGGRKDYTGYATGSAMLPANIRKIEVIFYIGTPDALMRRLIFHGDTVLVIPDNTNDGRAGRSETFEIPEG